jgi:hypothetical protein
MKPIAANMRAATRAAPDFVFDIYVLLRSQAVYKANVSISSFGAAPAGLLLCCDAPPEKKVVY